MATKKQRLKAVEDIVSTETIRSQDDLQKSLNSKGFNVTQATLSRDMKELKLVRIFDESGEYVYVLPQMPKAKKRTSAVLRKNNSIEFSGKFAVIKTRPGYANGLASDIDRYAPEGILATIAGDDTILVIPRDGFSKTDIKKALKKFIN